MDNGSEFVPERLIIQHDGISESLQTFVERFIQERAPISNMSEIGGLISDLFNIIIVFNDKITPLDIVMVFFQFLVPDISDEFILENLSVDLDKFLRENYAAWIAKVYSGPTIVTYEGSLRELFDLFEDHDLEQVFVIAGQGKLRENDNVVIISNVLGEKLFDSIVIVYYYYHSNKGQRVISDLNKKLGKDIVRQIFERNPDVTEKTYEQWKEPTRLEKLAIEDEEFTDFIALNSDLPFEEIYALAHEKNKLVTLEDIAMAYYSGHLEDENIVRIIYNKGPWLKENFLEKSYGRWIILNDTKFDNDNISLYKWREQEQKDTDVPFPVRLTVVKKNNDKYSFTSLKTFLTSMMMEGSQASDFYDAIIGADDIITETITEQDIAMTYYEKLFEDNSRDEDEILEEMNKFYRDIQGLEQTTFATFFQLSTNYEEWKKKYDRDVIIDDKKFNRIYETQNQLHILDKDENNTITVSQLVVTSSFKIFNPTLDGVPVSIEDGFDIFNHSKVSQFVPFICYNDANGNPIYRVFTELRNEKDFNENKDKIIIPKDKIKDENTIYLRLWLGDPNTSSFYSAPGETFYIVYYYLKSNEIIIESPIKEHISSGSDAYKRVRAALPTLVFGEENEFNIKGNFSLYNVKFDETAFLSTLLNDDFMREFLYIEEVGEPFPFKRRSTMDVYFRNIFTKGILSKLTLDQRTTPENEPYINVSVLEGKSKHDLNNFMIMFRLVMMYYVSKEEDELIKYEKDFPGREDEQYNDLEKLQTALEDKFISREKEVKPAKKKKTLQEKAPDLFINKYTGDGCGFPPFIIDEDEIDEYEDSGRQVMPFPKNNPKWHFVCPDGKLPYPGVKENTKLPNKDIYPYIPCCFAKDQINGKNSKYQQYLAMSDEPQVLNVGAKGFQKIKNNKMLSPNTTAYLPITVENITRKYSDRVTDMVRYGVIYSTNSLLHCICFAIDDPNYMVLKTNNEKELYVAKLRLYIRDNINLALLKQELYDYTEKDIIELFTDNNIFLDPYLVYRAIEEFFNINVYVFTASEAGELEIPRYKIFHARPLRLYRPTVVLIKVIPNKKDLQIPKCELVVDFNAEKMQIVKLFGESMTKICHDIILENILKIAVISERFAKNYFEVHDNIYYKLDHKNMFKTKLMGQIIDDNGKMRALILNFDNKLITVTTIPSQPENVPIENEIHRASIDDVLTIFGKPSAITKNSDDLIDGLWFSVLDIELGEYIPIIPSTIVLNLPLGPPNPLGIKGISVTARLRKLKRTLNIIVQLISWCYDIVRSHMIMTPYVFVDQYVRVIEKNIDSSNYYDFSKLNRHLPTVGIETIEDAIAAMPTETGLFAEGKIIAYSEEFRDRLVGMLIDYDNLSHVTEIGKDYKVIENFYETSEDFINNSDDKVFMNVTELNNWLDSLKVNQRHNAYFNIHDKIEATMRSLNKPFIYQNEYNELYIIQNSNSNDIKKALAIAQYWKEKHINIGNDIEILEQLPPYLLYAISPAQKLVLIANETNKNSDFVEILYYGSEHEHRTNGRSHYAAMLNIQ